MSRSCSVTFFHVFVASFLLSASSFGNLQEARDDFRELGLAAHEAPPLFQGRSLNESFLSHVRRASLSFFLCKARACLRLAALAHQAEEGLESGARFHVYVFPGKSFPECFLRSFSGILFF